MHIMQPPLLSFNDFFKLDYSDRLHLVLVSIDAERLLRALDGDSPQLPGAGSAGPQGYPARVLWSSLIAGVVYRIPTIAELIRNLESNPYLRITCGILSAAGVPSAPTFSRFLSRLVKHEGLLDGCLDDLVRRFAVLAPGFGESVAGDSTDVHAYSRGKKAGASDPDATWGAKDSKEGPSKGRKGKDGKEEVDSLDRVGADDKDIRHGDEDEKAVHGTAPEERGEGIQESKEVRGRQKGVIAGQAHRDPEVRRVGRGIGDMERFVDVVENEGDRVIELEKEVRVDEKEGAGRR